MKRMKKIICMILFIVFILSINVYSSYGQIIVEQSDMLKEEYVGAKVIKLQEDLKELGFFPASLEATGYFGSATKSAVIKFQRTYGLVEDGIAGINTLNMVDAIVNNISIVSRGETENLLMPWYNGVIQSFKVGYEATIYDIKSGAYFNIKRTYGTNHADCETLTAKDTEIFLNILGGEWEWQFRPVIVYANGQRFAASLAGMPHAGRDDKPAEMWVSNRSDGFGTGHNLDAIKGNNMNGVIDLHFIGSRRHVDNSVDSRHQTQIYNAYNWAMTQ